MKDVDMLFVIDSSGSIKSHNFEKIKRFLVDMVDMITSNSRVAVVRFDHNPVTMISFGDHSNKNVLKGMTGGFNLF